MTVALVVLAVVAVYALLMLLAYSLCRVASEADDDLGR